MIRQIVIPLSEVEELYTQEIFLNSNIADLVHYYGLDLESKFNKTVTTVLYDFYNDTENAYYTFDFIGNSYIVKSILL